MRLLVATAVPPARDAVARAFGAPDTPEETALPGAVLLRTPGADVLAAGVGPAAAASATSAALTAARLAGNPYDLVVSAGIGGGFAERAPVGAVVVADRIVAADLGAETPDGFVPVTGLGFGTDVHVPPAALVEAAREAGLVPGAVLTVSTVTGSAGRAAELLARHPSAVAEAMEGFGVAEAAAAHGVPVLEIRAVSNAIGPRDRDAWRIPAALTALTSAFVRLAPAEAGSPFALARARLVP
ncbi:futalosine hydrolase [Streptomyces albidoflavus]